MSLEPIGRVNADPFGEEQRERTPFCPNGHGPMKLRTRGSDGSKFWGCRSYPDCKRTIDYEGNRL